MPDSGAVGPSLTPVSVRRPAQVAALCGAIIGMMEPLPTASQVGALTISQTWIVAAAILLTAPAALGQAGGDDVDPDMDFQLPAAEIASLEGDGGLELDDADFVGNPLATFAEWWPEDLVLAPIPGRSPQLGWSLTLAAGYFLGERDEDHDSAPSLIGGFGMVAENGSYGYGAGTSLHLLDDKLRVQAGVGYLDIRYRFYGIGNDAGDRGISIDILQEAPMYFATAKYRVWSKLYVGLGYLGGEVETRVRFNTNFFDPSLTLDIGALVIPLQFDTRDHEQFPRDGWLIDGKGVLYSKDIGGDFDAETFAVAVNRYLPMRARDVLALRGYVRATGDDEPFFILSTFGGSKDLRGYPSGRYRDRMMYALQGEYRWQVNDRWILTGFAGFGEVANSFSDFGENYLPAGGVGARFVLSKKHRVGLSADLAVGNDGAEVYFGVGEAF